MNQVSKDVQLLDTARDCLQFVAKFFGLINVSATHIYHSALELCPRTSIVRRLYYDQCHGITRFPRVLVGTPDSWEPTVSLSGWDYCAESAWSPCGRFIVRQTQEIVEIYNHLTFELLAVLRYPKLARTYWSRSAYSPDGRSFASLLPNSLVIWDIQTGGVVLSIDSHTMLSYPVWSLDGRRIIFRAETSRKYTAEAYDVASGAQLFETEIPEEIIHLWACGESFLILTKSPTGPDNEMTISEIGPTCTRIESLREISLQSSEVKQPPYAYRVPLLTSTESVHILATGDSHRLLSYPGHDKFKCGCISSDGSHLSVPHSKGFWVWKYTSGSFVFFRGYSFFNFPGFQTYSVFSPTSTSILSIRDKILQLLRLHDPPTTPQNCRQHAAISRSGRYFATADQSQSTVAITDIESHTISQFIDTGGEIEGLAITDNVLLVAFLEKVVGWLLTEQGTVDGVVDGERAGRSDSLWTVTSLPQHPQSLCFRIGGQVGVIGTDNTIPFVYHTDTGRMPNRVLQPQNFSSPWISLYQPSDYQEYHHLRHPYTVQHDPTYQEMLMAPLTQIKKEGWVVDLEGRHRLWVPVEWRGSWDHKNWHYDISTLFVRKGDRSLCIKF